MSIQTLNLQKLGVDLTPAIPHYTGWRMSETDGWDPIPEDQIFDLVCYPPSIWDTDALLTTVPAVVSKAGRTPFRMSATGTGDQGCVEAEIVPNTEDYTEEEWKQIFGNQYKLVNRSYHGRNIKINFSHPQWGMTDAFVSLADSLADNDGLVCKVSIPYPPRRRTPAIGYVPLDAVIVRDGLTSYSLEGLNQYGWEPDPAEVDRIRKEVERWNATEWIPMKDEVTIASVDTLNDSDSRKVYRNTYTRVRYKDPTHHFRGLQEVAGKRYAPDEVDALFPTSLWMERHLDSLLPQWEK